MSNEIKISPCDSTHQEYCYRVVKDSLTKTISQMTVIHKNDIQKINELLLWKPESVFMRPSFKYENNGLFAHQCFWDWDTKGVSLPDSLEDPTILENLVQSKRVRDFTIDQWVETYRMRSIYSIWPEEYMNHPGMNVELFKKLFGRNPNKEILRIVG